MLFRKLIIVCFVLVLTSSISVNARKSKRGKKNKDKNKEETQPENYPSFGFNFDGNGTNDLQSLPIPEMQHGMFHGDAKNTGDLTNLFPNIDLTKSLANFGFNNGDEHGISLNINIPEANQANGISFSTKSEDTEHTSFGMEKPVYGTKIKGKDTVGNPDSQSDTEHLNFENMFKYANDWASTMTEPGGAAKPSSSTYLDDDFKGTIDLTTNKDKDQMDFLDTKQVFKTMSHDKDESVESKFKDTLRDAKKNRHQFDYTNNKFENSDLYNSYKDQFKSNDFPKFQQSTFNSLDYTTTKAPFKIAQFSSTGSEPTVSSSNFNFGSPSGFKTNFGFHNGVSHSSTHFGSTQKNLNDQNMNSFNQNFPKMTSANEDEEFSMPSKSKNIKPKPFHSGLQPTKSKYSPWTGTINDNTQPSEVTAFSSEGFNTNAWNELSSISPSTRTKNSFGDGSFGNGMHYSPQTDFSKYKNNFSGSKRPTVTDFTSGKTEHENQETQSDMQPWYSTGAPQYAYKESSTQFNAFEAPGAQTSVWFQSPHASYSSTFGENAQVQFHSKTEENKMPQYTTRPEAESEKVIHIKPRNPGRVNFNKQGMNSGKMTIDDWNKEVLTKFKSEEDLLGLRTKDTSHPSYLPSFKLHDDSEAFSTTNDYNKAMEKWRSNKPRKPQSFDSSPSEATYKPQEYTENYVLSKEYGKAINNWNDNKYAFGKQYQYDNSVAESTLQKDPNSYRIEIPHPVIVPVPQPYPVKVPIPKPVAVPVVRELRIPIEKPVPYPVVKKVPYPVEKPVPVPIEKQVAVPVPRPYPVPIPHIKPIFHTTKYNYFHDDAGEFDQDLEQTEFVPMLNTEFLSSGGNSRKRSPSQRKKNYKNTYVRKRLPKHVKRINFFRRQNSFRDSPVVKKIVTRYTGRSMSNSEDDGFGGNHLL